MRDPSFKVNLLLIFLLLASACAKKTISTSTQSGGHYSEDLSVWRPKVEPVKGDTGILQINGNGKQTKYVEARYTVNSKLDMVLDSIDRYHLARKYVEGFTIQVYSGRREEALNMKKQLSSLMPELNSEIQFLEPIFRVKAGRYYNRIDAQKDFAEIKKYFPTAILIPEKIPVN